MNHWIFENMTPKLVDMDEWRRWIVSTDLRIDYTKIESVEISTVFMGSCTAFGMLFETMIFGGSSDGYLQRYKTLGEAKQGHHDVVEKVQNERIKNG